jgi:hypothetical protein
VFRLEATRVERRIERRPTHMLRRCTEPGCSTLTLGGPCTSHDLAPRPVFVRGRPFVPAASSSAGTATALTVTVAHDLGPVYRPLAEKC